MSRLYALVLLGWHFLLHVLKKITFTYRPGGIEQFRENYDPDGLAPLTAREHELIDDWQRCIGCGLCEAACAEMAPIPEQRHHGPSYVAICSMRDLSEADLAIPSTDAIDACDRDELQQICPVDIPLGDLADFLQRIGQER